MKKTGKGIGRDIAKKNIFALALFCVLTFTYTCLYAYTTPDGVCGFVSSHTIHVKQYNITDSAEDVAYTATGVSEQAGVSKSCYLYTFTLTGGKAYMLCMKDITASPIKEVCWTVPSYQTSVDALTSSRSTFAGGAVASVTDPVTVGTNNDKSGYSGTATNMVAEAPSVTQIRTEMDDNSTKFALLDGAFDGMALESTLTDMKGVSWNGETLKVIKETVDTVGDPWTVLVPGSYTSGQAGYKLGHPELFGSLVLPVMQGKAYTTFIDQTIPVKVVQGNTASIPFDFNGNYNGYAPVIAAKVNLTDTEFAIAETGCSWVDASKGQGTCPLSSVDTAIVRRLIGEIRMTRTGSVITGMMFKLDIVGGVIR